MAEPKRGYGTKDLEGARFEAQVLQVLRELKDDIGTALRILERHDEQIRTVDKRVDLHERDIQAAHRRLDTFEARATFSPADYQKTIDRIDLALAGIKGGLPQNLMPRLEELEKLSPVVRAIKWIGAVVGGLVIALVWKAFLG